MKKTTLQRLKDAVDEPKRLTKNVYTRSIYNMERKIKKWGNSLAVRIPKELVDKLGIDENTPVALTGDQGRLVVNILPKKRGRAQDIWRDYLIPTGNKKKRNISGRIDQILYGKPD